MGIKHFDSKRHPLRRRPLSHKSRLFGRRETHPISLAFSSLGHETGYRRWLLPQVSLREPSWKGAFTFCNWRSSSRPYTAHRNRPQDSRETSNQTCLRFFRSHSAKTLEERPFTTYPRTKRGLQGQSQWLESLRKWPGGGSNKIVRNSHRSPPMGSLAYGSSYFPPQERRVYRRPIFGVGSGECGPLAARFLFALRYFS